MNVIDHLHQIRLEAEVRLNYFSKLDLKKYLHLMSELESTLKKECVTLEGKPNPVSLNPTILYEKEVLDVGADLQTFHDMFDKIILRFTQDHLAGLNGPLHHFFSPYKKWFQIIAEEKRSLSTLNYCRFDTTYDETKGWQIMEVNTRCPAGVIKTSKCRDAFKGTGFHKDLLEKHSIREFPIDRADGFLQYLLKLTSKKAPHFAICNYKGVFTNEFELLSTEFPKISKGQKLIICDIRDIHEKEGTIYAKETPVSLIYNKLNPLMIDPDDPSIKGWLAASRSEHCNFLNSLGAMYLTDTKRILALLQTKSMQDLLHFTEEERKVVQKYVPKTQLIQEADLYELLLNRHEFVLKPDALSRGQEIYIGLEYSFQEWSRLVFQCLTKDFVVQKYLNHQKKDTYVLKKGAHPELLLVKEWYGIDFFYFGGDFSGVMSRSSESPIFNICRTGSNSPVFVLKS